MKFNIFEGARRIALLVAGIATIGTLVVAFNYEPYVSVNYKIADPRGEFIKTEDSCTSKSARHYFDWEIRPGKEVKVNLCLIATKFEGVSEKLVPYKLDQDGNLWSDFWYSENVSSYALELEKRFKLSKNDVEILSKEISKKYQENMIEAIGYLALGLGIFAAIVCAIGWIVRGFLGIPGGMDKRQGD